VSGLSVKKEILHLVTFISLLKQLRNKKTADEAGFHLVNEFSKTVTYRQCLYWVYRRGAVKILHASGQTEVSEDSPYIRHLANIIEQKIKKEGYASRRFIQDKFEENGAATAYTMTPTEIQMAEIEADDELYDYRPAESTVCAICTDDRDVLGGIWIDRNKKYENIEIALIEDTADALAEKMRAEKSKGSFLERTAQRFKNIGFLIFLAVLFAGFIPVRLSVTAPAEVISQDTYVVTSPINGMIEEVLVKPNQNVSQGDILFYLDRTELRNGYNLGVQKLATARAALEKTERERLSDPSKSVEVNALKEQIKLRKLELEYYETRLDLAEIKAPRDGVVLFSDVNDILGKPVKIGTQVMKLADPDKLELLIRIPTHSIIDLEDNADVEFFLNVDPLHSHDAELRTISYQSSKDEDGLLSYKARAVIENPQDVERVGLTGTAKVYGDKTLFIINVLRRPMIAVRNLIGGAL
jgi:multidrug resistance efflux pump